jgi:hypothetical protein
MAILFDEFDALARLETHGLANLSWYYDLKFG